MSANWQLLEKLGEYYIWRYEDEEGRYIYNATKEEDQPTNEAGYYSYAYLLKVKGLMSGLTVNQIFHTMLK